jgi:hypothetical protein
MAARKKLKKDEVVRKVLARAFTILKDPKRWTKGTFAKTQSNSSTFAGSPHAAKFCAVGGIERAMYELYGAGYEVKEAYATWEGIRQSSVDVLQKCVPEKDPYSPRRPVNVTVYNDQPRRKHSDIVQLYRCALERIGINPDAPEVGEEANNG